MSSCWGNRLRISIFGQSHSGAVGVVMDGLPAGFKVDMEELNAFMARRAPGRSGLGTPRTEADAPEFCSGLVNGVTCGAPLSIMIRSDDVRPGDYSQFADAPRPGHADFTAQMKYRGFQDISGGGHFSGRLTAPLCAAGGICIQMLRDIGVDIGAHIYSLGTAKDRAFDPVKVSKKDFDALIRDPLTVIDPAAGELMAAEILRAKEEEDSVGGVIECAVAGMTAGIGDPMFDGVENRIASIVFGIPAVKGVEFGSGFAGSQMRGSENNDSFITDGRTVTTKTNNHGGILGGITSGMPVIFRVAFKPTPSIGKPQRTVSLSAMCERELVIKGRHDPCVVPRAVPCVEAASAIAMLDMML